MKARFGVVLALALVLGSGCMPVPLRAPMSDEGLALLDDAARAGLELANPATMDAYMMDVMDREIGRGGTPSARMTRLRQWMHDGVTPYTHVPLLTTDAKTAFRSRRGGCLTHAVLMVTLARYLGVDAYYVQASTVRQFADRGDALVAMTHMAVGFHDGIHDSVIDVWVPVEDWRLVHYEHLDDALVLALYHSNLAVEDLSPARLPQAARELHYLAEHAPTVPEVVSNLTAVLLRQRKYDEALAVAREAIERFPRFKPLYTNAYVAAVRSGKEALAADLARRSRAIREEDPVFVVARGVSDFESGRYDAAATAFERALTLQPDSVVVHAWLVRARVASGDARAASAVFARAWRLAPEDPRLLRVLVAHPELRADVAR